MDETGSRKVATFGGILLMLVGAFNVLDGVVALANPDYEHAELLVGNMTAWGWFLLVFGVMLASRLSTYCTPPPNWMSCHGST